jgi:transcriptional regulator with XRE-family HTH domain
MKTDWANVIRLEKGRTRPSTRTLERIAKATGHKLVVNAIPGGICYANKEL